MSNLSSPGPEAIPLSSGAADQPAQTQAETTAESPPQIKVSNQDVGGKPAAAQKLASTAGQAAAVGNPAAAAGALVPYVAGALVTVPGNGIVAAIPHVAVSALRAVQVLYVSGRGMIQLARGVIDVGSQIIRAGVYVGRQISKAVARDNQATSGPIIEEVSSGPLPVQQAVESVEPTVNHTALTKDVGDAQNFQFDKPIYDSIFPTENPQVFGGSGGVAGAASVRRHQIAFKPVFFSNSLLHRPMSLNSQVIPEIALIESQIDRSRANGRVSDQEYTKLLGNFNLLSISKRVLEEGIATNLSAVLARLMAIMLGYAVFAVCGRIKYVVINFQRGFKNRPSEYTKTATPSYWSESHSSSSVVYLPDQFCPTDETDMNTAVVWSLVMAKSMGEIYSYSDSDHPYTNKKIVVTPSMLVKSKTLNSAASMYEALLEKSNFSLQFQFDAMRILITHMGIRVANRGSFTPVTIGNTRCPHIVSAPLADRVLVAGGVNFGAAAYDVITQADTGAQIHLVHEGLMAYDEAKNVWSLNNVPASTQIAPEWFHRQCEANWLFRFNQIHNMINEKYWELAGLDVSYNWMVDNYPKPLGDKNSTSWSGDHVSEADFTSYVPGERAIGYHRESGFVELLCAPVSPIVVYGLWNRTAVFSDSEYSLRVLPSIGDLEQFCVRAFNYSVMHYDILRAATGVPLDARAVGWSNTFSDHLNTDPFLQAKRKKDMHSAWAPEALGASGFRFQIVGLSHPPLCMLGIIAPDSVDVIDVPGCCIIAPMLSEAIGVLTGLDQRISATVPTIKNSVVTRDPGYLDHVLDGFSMNGIRPYNIGKNEEYSELPSLTVRAKFPSSYLASYYTSVQPAPIGFGYLISYELFGDWPAPVKISASPDIHTVNYIAWQMLGLGPKQVFVKGRKSVDQSVLEHQTTGANERSHIAQSVDKNQSEATVLWRQRIALDIHCEQPLQFLAHEVLKGETYEQRFSDLFRRAELEANLPSVASGIKLIEEKFGVLVESQEHVWTDKWFNGIGLKFKLRRDYEALVERRAASRLGASGVVFGAEKVRSHIAYQLFLLQDDQFDEVAKIFSFFVSHYPDLQTSNSVCLAFCNSLTLVAREFGTQLSLHWMQLMYWENLFGAPPIDAVSMQQVALDVEHWVRIDDAKKNNLHEILINRGIDLYYQRHILPNFTGVSTRVKSIADWVTAPSDWLTSGASTAPGVSGYSSSKWSSYLNDGIVGTLKRLEDESDCVYRVSIKRERAKLRTIINCPYSYYLQQSFLAYVLPDYILSFNTPLSKSFDNVAWWQAQTLSTARGIGWMLPIDQSKFDHTPSLQVIARLMSLMCYCAVPHVDRDSLWVLEMCHKRLFQAKVVFEGKSWNHERGILSGWNFTAIFDTIINYCEFLAILQIAAVPRRMVTHEAFMGDDASMMIKDPAAATRMAVAYAALLPVNVKKTFISRNRNEFLRLVMCNGVRRGYLTRAIPGVLMLQPWQSSADRADPSAIVQNWVTLVSRGADESSVVECMVCDLTFVLAARASDIVHWLISPKTFGGCGLDWDSLRAATPLVGVAPAIVSLALPSALIIARDQPGFSQYSAASMRRLPAVTSALAHRVQALGLELGVRLNPQSVVAVLSTGQKADAIPRPTLRIVSRESLNALGASNPSSGVHNRSANLTPGWNFERVRFAIDQVYLNWMVPPTLEQLRDMCASATDQKRFDHAKARMPRSVFMDFLQRGPAPWSYSVDPLGNDVRVAVDNILNSFGRYPSGRFTVGDFERRSLDGEYFVKHLVGMFSVLFG